MPEFDANATSEQIVEAFSAQIKGRIFVITGGGQPGIGSSMATTLARASPEHILIASRTAANVEPVLAAIREAGVKASFVQVDLTDHGSVRRAAKEILDATASKIDVLINNAGVMAIKEYTVDKQGIEMQLSANHVGHFLLTNLLAPALIAAAKADPRSVRVVNLSSHAYHFSPFRVDDYNFSGGQTYDLWTGYGQAKTANILFTYGLTKRLQQHGVVSFAAHPGSNFDTKLAAHLTSEDYSSIFAIAKRNTGCEFVVDQPRSKTYEQIGATPLAAAVDPDLTPKAPGYLVNSQTAEPARYACDPETVEKLWELSEKLVGQKFSY
ncbi:NAD(P)-binding protein [Hypoxylon argillaceum]|nr:NAD(P)-binding protein [Hypoxylon argillaceum]